MSAFHATELAAEINEHLDGYESDEDAISDLITVFSNARRIVDLARASQKEVGT